MGVSTIASLFVGINALAITSALPNSPVAGQVNGKPPQVDGQGALPVADNMGDTYTSSFTYNYECTGPTMACGPNWYVLARLLDGLVSNYLECCHVVYHMHTDCVAHV